MADDDSPFVEAPCGCVITTIGDAFVMQPCSLLCENYLFLLERAKEHEKPVKYLGSL